ncbi:flagellar biosynthesis protein flip [Xanthomonas vasicola pv. vasculorum NCPPB 895]|uniref:flagellar type III secretion system pore protein FliP n=1 Tax=Xanthomonas vasicola TaxID=56459 RepID=UPI0003494294|nr:flagellar type III secretion system pore protein FliP [Xanthomonas vasicola]KEZ94799.1 flagellar biosynthesis protein flip [Xanthomonas vasicola pv. vasculorum NCPPB 895]
MLSRWNRWGRSVRLVLVLLVMSCPMLAAATPATPAALPAMAQAAAPAVQAGSNQLPSLPNVSVGRIGDQPVSLPLQTLLLMTAITLLPSMLLVLTAFTRITIVLGLLRQALGTGQTPANQVLLGLSMFLTALVMMPVWQKMWGAGLQPYLNNQIDFSTAWTLTTQPLRAFMLAQIRETDLMTFAGMAGDGKYAGPDAVPFPVLVASFVTSELKTAFEIGFLIFIPFVIIDLVVASVLMSMGMMMLSPMLISAPFKILLFILVDGWVLVVGTLAASFNAS